MTVPEAAALGLIQGATEFLPISSSGHLLLVPAVIGIPEPNLNVIAIAHLGTLLAVVVYFFKDLWAIATAVIGGVMQGDPLGSANARLGWFIVIGSIPAAVLGLSFEQTLDQTLGTPRFAAGFLLCTAALLLVGERLRTAQRDIATMTWRHAWLIGFAQALALLPGISRSGSTIVAGLLCGFSREAAARYSFLLGTPVILGAGLLALSEVIDSPDLSAQTAPLITTFCFAAVSGFLCIHWLLRWLRIRSLLPFAIYCALFGAGYLLFGTQ